ncbi:cell division ATP-binding protein FtsE [Bartonella sp. DGB1]|uniref:cell division ATP-binding protein FtsE n=1 Tax=Bartonella sp. DGB1 TaxID=3239807 RepID=UPI0035253911
MIYFRNVGIKYGLGNEILSDINLHIAEGSFQFLTGQSGAGKTTLLRLMFQALRPTRGIINIFGQDIALLDQSELAKLRRRIGIVFQDFRLLDHLTIYDNVALPLRIAQREEIQFKSEIIELLQWIGLGKYINVYPPVLSGGEKQRVAIARAVITKPEILLADEPTGNVDPHLARRLLLLLIELNRLGTAIVFATHDNNLMQQVSGRHLILKDGRLTVNDNIQ